MVFTFLFEISDFWRHLAFFFITSKIKPNALFISFSVKKWIILTIFSQNCNFFEVLHELIKSIWKEFWAKIPVWWSASLSNNWSKVWPLEMSLLVTICWWGKHFLFSFGAHSVFLSKYFNFIVYWLDDQWCTFRK